MTPRFYQPDKLEPGQSVALTTNASFHAQKVLRLSDASAVVLFNGDGHPYASQLQIEGKRVSARVLEQGARDPVSSFRFVLGQALLSNDKMAWVIEKAAELGVDEIVPLATHSAKVKLDEQRGQAKQERWQELVQSACAQSGRNTVPTVQLPMSLGQFLTPRVNETVILFEPGEHTGFSSLLKSLPADKHHTVRLVIGPESGFIQAEVDFARKSGALVASLGWRVLRTETAGLAVLAIGNQYM
jgi:16S rRNA (uracil1498-N3)-methyltransferase